METAAVNQMKELVKKLNEAAKAYYQEDREIMSNREYDDLYDQLESMEAETGIVLADSPPVSLIVSLDEFLIRLFNSTLSSALISRYSPGFSPSRVRFMIRTLLSVCT